MPNRFVHPPIRTLPFMSDDPVRDYLAEPYITASTNNPPRQPETSPSFHEYLRLVQLYIDSLSNSDARESDYIEQEYNILRLMETLGFFREIPSRLVGIPRVRINARYDVGNLAHRFLVLYLRDFIVIEDIDYLVARRPTSRNCTSPPMIAFRASDLDFLDNRTIAPNRSLRVHASSDEFDFIVNNQKIRLCIQAMNNSGDRQSRYVDAINLRITSERGTNIRNLVRLESQDRNLFFKRSRFNRPIHGFRFVHVSGGGRDGLVVKEIH